MKKNLMLFSLLITSCAEIEKETPYSNKDGTIYLTVYESRRGASSSNRIRIDATFLENNQEIKKFNILTGSGGSKIKIHWIDYNEALIEYCDADRYSLFSRSFVDYKDKLFSLSLFVISKSEVKFKNKVYC